MPLYSDDPASTRRAYAALEARAEAAQRLADQLRGAGAPLGDGGEVDARAAMRQRVADLEAEVITLRGQLEQVAAIAADMHLDQFIGAVGLAVAVGEASMPGRTISTFDVAVNAFVAPAGGRVGLRFQQPELNGEPRGLSTTSFKMARVPPAPGTPSPPSLHDVLVELQAVFGDPAWSGVPASADVVVEVGRTLADVSGWSFPGLVERAGAIAAVERRVAAQLVPRRTEPGRLERYSASVEALARVVDQLHGSDSPTASDLARLVDALAASASAAKALMA